MPVFISRQQLPNSPFYTAVSPYAEVIGQSLVTIEPVVPPALPKSDWLFFYSKNGIRHGLPHWLEQELLPPIGVIGSGSAAFLKEHYGLDADFVGNGTPTEIAQAFGSIAAGKRVAFAQAMESRRSVQLTLSDRIQASEVVVYKNSPVATLTLPFCPILVFTSPMNVAAYFAHYALAPSQKIISIGLTTGAALAAQGIHNYQIAAAPNEPALALACLRALGIAP